jgi:hypothetical protein
VTSLAVWGKSELNPFSHLIINVVARYCKDQAEADPNASGAFRFAERGSLARILAEAGAVDIKERVLKFNIVAPISVEQFWEMRSEMSETLREKLATLSSSQLDLLAKEAKQAVSEFFSNSGMSIPAQMIIVTGRKLKETRPREFLEHALPSIYEFSNDSRCLRRDCDWLRSGRHATFDRSRKSRLENRPR